MESNTQNTNELENIAKKIAERRQQRVRVLGKRKKPIVPKIPITDWENQGIKKKEIKNGQTIVEKIRPVDKHVLTQLINRINKKEMLRPEVIKYAVRVELNNIISNQMMPILSQKGIEKLERKAVNAIEEVCQNINLNHANESQSEIEPQNQIINFLTSKQTNTTLSTAPSSQDSNIIIINPYQDSQYESAEKPRNPKAKQKKDEQSNRLQGSMNSGMSNVVNINQNQLHQEFLEDRNKSNSKDTMKR